MNRKEAVQILAILKASYPNFYKNLTQEDAQGIVSVWHMQFAEISAEVVFMALNKAISMNKFPPTVAEVKEKIHSVHWEAYEIIQRHHKVNYLGDAELERYKWIYKETESFKFSRSYEPSISHMIGGGSAIKKLEKGE